MTGGINLFINFKVDITLVKTLEVKIILPIGQGNIMHLTENTEAFLWISYLKSLPKSDH